MNLLIQNIRQLVTCAARGRAANVGPAMRNLGVIENATVLINDGKIRWVGPA